MTQVLAAPNTRPSFVSLPVDVDLVPAHDTPLQPLAPSPQPSSSPWQRARHWTSFAIRFDRCKLACQIMAGFELLALRKTSGITHGGHRRTRSTTASPNDSDLPQTWPNLVKHHLGISEDTARNWMSMADAARPRLKKLGGAETLAAILDKPASAWADEETQVVETTVHKISDGKTQLDFMRELGLVRIPQGGAATGGHRPGPGKPKLPPAEAARANAQSILHPLILALFALRTTQRDVLLHTPLSTPNPARIASLTHLHEELTEALAVVQTALETARRAPRP